jgi:hypothetical protein
MTIGSCGGGRDDIDCLYIADIGDNKAQGSGQKTQRPNKRPYTIFKVFEPQIDDFITDNPVLSSFHPITALQIDYSHETSPTPFANSEAVFIDHTGSGQDESIGDIYLVTKWNSGKNSNKWTRLFKIPVSAWSSRNTVEQYSPEAVGSYNTISDPNNPFFNMTWTGAAMSSDGEMIALTEKNTTHIFLRCPGVTVAESLTADDVQSCTSYINPDEGAHPGKQYEAISFSPDGKTIYNMAESLVPPKIIHVDLDYNFASAQRCPEQSTNPSFSSSIKPSSASPSLKYMSPSPSLAPSDGHFAFPVDQSSLNSISSSFGSFPGSELLLFVIVVCYIVIL